MTQLSLRRNSLSRISSSCIAGMLLTFGGGSFAEESEKRGFESVEKEILNANDWVVLGAGAAVAPRFQGSDDYRVRPVPLFDVQKGRFFARTGDGIGFHVFDSPRFLVGVSVDWMQGYDEGDDVPDGIGDLDDEAGGKVFVSTRVGGVIATLSGTQVLDEDEDEGLRGMVINARLAYPYPVTERLMVVPGIAMNWANTKYMTSYFGVDATRNTNSGLDIYEPSASVKDVSIRLAFNYRWSESWNVTGAISVSQLLNQAADSPLVESESQASALVGITYAF